MPPSTGPRSDDDAASAVLERFRTWFPDDSLTLVDRAGAMAARFNALGPQRPATCGAYALSYLLPALGFTKHAGIDLSAEDYLAHLAAVVVEADEVGPSDVVTRRVAAGELSTEEALQQFGRTWYRFPVRSSADPVESGTSPTGIARAIEHGTEGALGCLPVAGRTADGSVALHPARWDALLQLLADHAADWGWHAVLNYEVNQVLNPVEPEYRVENLRAEDADVRIPRDDWGVGHFAGVLGLWRRRVDHRWWLVLLDTYKERGFTGYQPQPAELVRRAIVREDGRGGGMLLVLPRDVLARASRAVEQLGIEGRMWSNGSPEPEDWSWSPTD
jgi:Family of unknown function (DUF6885)